MVALLCTPVTKPVVSHPLLSTTFTGIEHPLSTVKHPIHQFRGIKYASIPARFRQSRLLTAYPSHTDATKYGPICPQLRHTCLESELLGIVEGEFPKQALKQNEFECLNLTVTRPAGHDRNSRIPVMVWFHGGWARGSGSSWLYDGGALVQKSAEMGLPILMVTFNYRVGLLGNAATTKLHEDNEANGDKGVGNYGLRDQQVLLQWIHHFIADFGGDSSDVTLFGESTGAWDILCHLYSAANADRHLFHRAILQSPAVDYHVPDVHTMGSHLLRTMASLHLSSVEDLQRVDVDRLIACPSLPRVTDDGYFFPPGWRDLMFGNEHLQHHLPSEHRPTHSPSSLPLQTVIIGDCTSESSLWSFPVSYWTASGIIRRIRAICQSPHKANALLRAYDISLSTPEQDLSERVLDLINDARFAWPISCVADALKRANDGKGVYRYVFDQESPSQRISHHAVDLIYLFDNAPMPTSADILPSSRSLTPDLSFSGSDDEGEDDFSAFEQEDINWVTPVVDEWSYSRVRDTIQERWISFAYGREPWHADKAFVFGPEGETGERSWSIFEGRRRTQIWKSSLASLGLPLVQKVGEELSNGPIVSSKPSF